MKPVNNPLNQPNQAAVLGCLSTHSHLYFKYLLTISFDSIKVYVNELPQIPLAFSTNIHKFVKIRFL